MNFTDWFEDVSNEKVPPSLVYYVGDIGTGKKTFVNSLVDQKGYRCININCIYDKDHSRLKKKTFVSELNHIVTNRNIEFFLTGKRDIVIIHNLHVITDKSFYDDIAALTSSVRFVTPVICILNRQYISERFLTYMTKGYRVFQHDHKSQGELLAILKEASREYGMKTLPKIFNDKMKNSNGNIYYLLTQLRYYSLTNSHRGDLNSEKDDKNIVTKCFDDLCNDDYKWSKKQEIIKSQGSLVRLLMPNHIFAGLDKDDSMTLRQKYKTAYECMNKMSKGEDVNGNNHSFYVALLQYVYPTLKVQNKTIKSMVLSNCQSTSGGVVLPRILYPHQDDQFIFILYYIIEAIEREQSRKKIKDTTPWNSWLPRLTKSSLNELQQKHFKIFDKYNISKKKINRFFLRLDGAIPDN